MKRIVLATAVAFACLAAPQMRAAEQQKPESLVKTLIRQAPGLRGEVLRLALAATERAADQGLVKRRDLLTVIDYSLPSSQPRLFVFNLVTRKLLFRELVAHGKNSGDDRATYFSNSPGRPPTRPFRELLGHGKNSGDARATSFSNSPGSRATSLGLFVTADTYVGNNGYSLRLKGLEEGINDMAWDRAIVMH